MLEISGRQSRHIYYTICESILQIFASHFLRQTRKEKIGKNKKLTSCVALVARHDIQSEFSRVWVKISA